MFKLTSTAVFAAAALALVGCSTAPAPAPTPAPTSAPPPVSNFRAVFSTYLGSTTQPHDEVSTSQRMGIALNANGGGSVGVGLLVTAGWSNYLKKTWALALNVLPKSRVLIQIEVLDASGTIVLARSNTSNQSTNEYNNAWFRTTNYGLGIGIPGNVLAAGMNYIVRVVATNVNTGEVTRSGNYNAYCFSTPVYEGGG